MITLVAEMMLIVAIARFVMNVIVWSLVIVLQMMIVMNITRATAVTVNQFKYLTFEVIINASI